MKNGILDIEHSYEHPSLNKNKDVYRIVWLGPFVGTCIIIASLLLLSFSPLHRDAIQRWAIRKLPLETSGLTGIAVACLLLVVGSLIAEYLWVRSGRLSSLAARINRATVYSLATVIGACAMLIVRDSTIPSQFYASSPLHKAIPFYAFCFGIPFYFFCFLKQAASKVSIDENTLPLFQKLVASLQNTNDYVIGIERPEDWKNCVEGPKRYLILPEKSIATNLLTIGGTGSGKTQDLVYQMLEQILRKFPGNRDLQPSICLLDVKGDNLEHIWRAAKAAGREDDCCFISPGNQLTDASRRPVLNDNGEPLIPKRLFYSWNPIGGPDPADIRATNFSDGLAVAEQKTSSDPYFGRVQKEFLIFLTQLFDMIQEPGTMSLNDVLLCCNDHLTLKSLIEQPQVRGTLAANYFEAFLQKEPKEQDYATGSLKAQLLPLTTDTTKETFAPKPGAETRVFPGFRQACFENPGIMVFSVPPGAYPPSLSRMLGITLLNQLYRDGTSRVKGNTDRFCFQFTDEAWAYTTDAVAEFTSTSRQSRVPSFFFTQGFEQFPKSTRATIMGNFRTKVLLAVNDSATLKEFEFLLGKTKRYTKTTSMSQGLNELQHGVVSDRLTSKKQNLSKSMNVSEALVPRFSTDEILKMKKGIGIMQLYDGADTRDSFAFETLPWYRLPYFLRHPFSSPLALCKKRDSRGKRQAHKFAMLETREQFTSRGKHITDDEVHSYCVQCGYGVDQRTREDFDKYSADFPHLLKTRSAAKATENQVEE